ncbi:MAG: ComEC family competence protein [Rhizobiaceae bacterium]|nr:ComEC family competence protein [Rhizobiaceae bacterium]
MSSMFAREMARGTAFNFIPVFLALGALFYFSAPFEPAWSYLLLPTVAFVILTTLLRRRILFHLASSAILCVLIGGCFAKLEMALADTKMLGSEISTRLTGRIVKIDRLARGRTRVTLDVLETERPKLRYGPDRIRITARSIPAEARAGDVLKGAARLLPPLGATRPGGYDFAFESYFDGIGATGFFLGAPTLGDASEEPGPRQRFEAVVEALRTHIAGRIRDDIGGPEGEIAAALVAGVRAGIPEDINEALRRTGLAHVLSISGLHMALVAATVIGGMRLGFSFFHGFSVRHPVRKYSAVIALVALASYLFISGSQVAAQRSFIMITVMLVALLFDRTALTMRNLAISAVIVLALSPHEVVGPSFQMSFAATVTLIGAYAAWSQRARLRGNTSSTGRHPLTKIGRRVLFYAAGLAATSILAGTATTIFGAYHFQRVSPLALFANLGAMPIVSVLVMPFAVLGMIAMPFGLDALPFAVMGEGLRIMVAVAKWFSDRSPLDVVGLIAPAAVSCLTLSLILATLLTTWMRLAALPFLIAGLVLLGIPARPFALISDDGKMVAAEAINGKLSINRSRANQFTLDNWKKALAIDAVVRPLNAKDGTLSALVGGKTTSLDDGQFRCFGDSCALHTNAGWIVTTADAQLASSLCKVSFLLVVGDATANSICPRGPATVVTRRDLARHGSASAQPNGEVTFAIREPYRPWHNHRQFSREARGMPPWQPKSRKGPSEVTKKPDPSPATRSVSPDMGANQPSGDES